MPVFDAAVDHIAYFLSIAYSPGYTPISCDLTSFVWLNGPIRDERMIQPLFPIIALEGSYVAHIGQSGEKLLIHRFVSF